MKLLIIVIPLVIVSIAIITFFLFLFTKRVLKNDNKKISLTLLILLIFQFILGMLSNLYITVPKVKSYEVYHYFGPIAIHTVNALFLIILAIFHRINAHNRKIKKETVLSGIGILGIIIATISGVSFVNSGGENNFYSLLMSLGFILSFLCYTYLSFSTERKKS